MIRLCFLAAFKIFLFITGFQQLDYDVLWGGFFLFILFGVFCASQICGVYNVHENWKILAIFFSFGNSFFQIASFKLLFSNWFITYIVHGV